MTNDEKLPNPPDENAPENGDTNSLERTNKTHKNIHPDETLSVNPERRELVEGDLKEKLLLIELAKRATKFGLSRDDIQYTFPKNLKDERREDRTDCKMPEFKFLSELCGEN
jgi:hypothetical protein